MVRYTPIKIQNALNSLKDAEENNRKSAELMKQMQKSLNRIKWAMFENFDEAIKTRLAEAKKEELKLLEKEDPYKFKHMNRGAIVGRRARVRLMRELKIVCNVIESERWEDFLWRFEKQWKRDREKLIKDGEIEVRKK